MHWTKQYLLHGNVFFLSSIAIGLKLVAFLSLKTNRSFNSNKTLFWFIYAFIYIGLKSLKIIFKVLCCNQVVEGK